MGSKPEAIFFDLDGTLTDPYPGITGCIRFALQELGVAVPPAEALRWCIGPPLRDSFVQLCGETQADQAVDLYRQRYTKIGLYENSVYSGIEELLLEIKKMNIVLHVASSKPLVYVERILQHFDLAVHFTAVFGSELTGERSDKSELLSFALVKTGHIGSRCVMVGDRKHDAIGAKANGMRPWGVAWGYAKDGELSTAGAERVFAAPADLGLWLAAGV